MFGITYKNMNRGWMIVAILLGIFSCKKSLPDDEKQLRIAFGSCAYSEVPIPIFDAVVEQDPSLWIWLGDIVYADTHDMNVMGEKYAAQKSKPEYQQLIASTKIIGIWDDHDYGVNDGGKYYTKKEESKIELLKFLDIAKNDPVRQHQGVYSSHYLSVGEKTVKLILLDTRNFRDTLMRDSMGPNRYLINPKGDILGTQQWQWLEKELSDSKADFHIIGSGIQVVAEEHGFEKWANFPKSRQRLFTMLAAMSKVPTLIISGDRHVAEISKINLPGMGYPLYDFTSSGLTHSYTEAGDEPNQYRVGKLVGSKNFGLINLSWSGQSATAVLEVRGENNELLDQSRITY